MLSSTDFKNLWFVDERDPAKALFLPADFVCFGGDLGEEEADEFLSGPAILFFASFMEVTPEERSCPQISACKGNANCTNQIKEQTEDSTLQSIFPHNDDNCSMFCYIVKTIIFERLYFFYVAISPSPYVLKTLRLCGMLMQKGGTNAVKYEKN